MLSISYKYLVKCLFFSYYISLVMLHSFVAFADNQDIFIISTDPQAETFMTHDAPTPLLKETDDVFDAFVHKKVLANGMTILVRISHVIPKVSLQIWYNVGSKDEVTGEKGIAHLIEHMIFKGTDILSESDINVLVHKLSGSCNAFTSFDYTGYLFNLPSSYWKEALPIMADCMLNCKFDQEMLNSEMKAVIQELKMYRDQYQRSLAEGLMSIIFSEHPYHYPIIGFKHDLWTVSSKDLISFYKKHYKPNNATLVVVGDVDPEDVFKAAEHYFGNLEADWSYKKNEYFSHQDIVSKTLTLYRDVNQPVILYAFVVPGSGKKRDSVLEIIQWVIGNGKSSRLYKKLINDTQLATSVGTSLWNLFDHSLFFIFIEPKNYQDSDQIEKIVREELADIVKHGITEQEFERGFKKAQVDLYSLLEHTEDQAYEIGAAYLATQDENYLFTSLTQPEGLLKQQAQEIITRYLRPSIMHKGFILPLPAEEKEQFIQLQKESDQEDERILSARVRVTPVEQPQYAQTVAVHNPAPFAFPKPSTYMLDNGLKLLYYNNATVPMITVSLRLKARAWYDPQDKQGLYNFVMNMITEGTQHYTSEQLADVIESRGMSIDVSPGSITLTMLHSDLEFGLEIVKEIVTNATFPEDEMEKVRDQLLAEIIQYWDEPRVFVSQLIREKIYAGHPYSKHILGTKESIASITQKDLIEFYKKYISPSQARIAIVGDLHSYQVDQIVKKVIGSWQGQEIEPLQFPPLTPVKPQEIKYPINRDQVVLALAQLSIERKHPDFDKYLLFDQIFSGGVLGSMSSRLFELREHTGLFYSIGGSLITGSDEQPGTFQVRTIVSLDRLQEAETAIKKTIDTVVDTITTQELDEAKRAIINTLVDNFASNNDIAATFLYLDRFNLPADYFDNRAQNIEKITLEDVQKAVKSLLNSKNMLTVCVGRVGDAD